jgi:hypothetical protein
VTTPSCPPLCACFALLAPAFARLCPPALLCAPACPPAFSLLGPHHSRRRLDGSATYPPPRPGRHIVTSSWFHRHGSCCSRCYAPLPLPRPSAAPTPHAPRPTPYALSLYLLLPTPCTPCTPCTPPFTPPCLAWQQLNALQSHNPSSHHQPTCKNITLHPAPPHSADTITIRCSPVLPARHDSSAQSSLGHAGCATYLHAKTDYSEVMRLGSSPARVTQHASLCSANLCFVRGQEPFCCSEEGLPTVFLSTPAHSSLPTTSLTV